MIDRRFFLVPLLLLSVSASAQSLATSDTSAVVLVERERDLTHALVRDQRAAINELVVEDFSCTVMAKKPFTLRPPSGRFNLCSGLGHDLSRRPDRPEVVVEAEKALPRTSRIDDVRVESLGDTTAVVISTQTYTNWFPYDGSFQRRSEVRDTWTLVGGRWMLKERVTTPLNKG